MVRERHRAGVRDRLGHRAHELHPRVHPAPQHSRSIFDRVRRSRPRRREATRVHGLRRRADRAALTTMSFVLTALVALLGASPAQAADLVVLCPNALATAVGRVAEENRTATGVGARLVTGTAGGLAAQAIAGATGDVIISTTAAVADLERRGVVRAGSRIEVGVIFIGVAVQKSARPPDVTTSEALRRALLDARSIGYADPARGGTGGII